MKVSLTKAFSRFPNGPLPGIRQQKRNDEVRREVLDAGCHTDRNLRAGRGSTPLSVLESLTTRTSAGALGGETTSTYQLQITRQLLGMSATMFTVQPGHCPHGGKIATVEDTSKVEDWPTVVTLKTNCGHSGTIQSEIDKLPATERRRCPFCAFEGRLVGVKYVEVVHNWDEGRPSTFFARLEGKGLSPPFSMSPGVIHSFSVKVFGDEYALCGVIYSTRSESHNQYSSQMYFEEGWWIYTDLEGGRVRAVRGFNEDFLSGSEHMLMYVRADLVAKRYGSEVAQRDLFPRPTETNKVSPARRNQSLVSPRRSLALSEPPTRVLGTTRRASITYARVRPSVGVPPRAVADCF